MHQSLLNMQILEDFASHSKVTVCTQRRSGVKPTFVVWPLRGNGFSSHHFHSKEPPLPWWLGSHRNTPRHAGERRGGKGLREGRDGWTPSHCFFQFQGKHTKLIITIILTWAYLEKSVSPLFALALLVPQLACVCDLWLIPVVWASCWWCHGRFQAVFPVQILQCPVLGLSGQALGRTLTSLQPSDFLVIRVFLKFLSF